jgi:hypothetical protein
MLRYTFTLKNTVSHERINSDGIQYPYWFRGFDPKTSRPIVVAIGAGEYDIISGWGLDNVEIIDEEYVGNNWFNDEFEKPHWCNVVTLIQRGDSVGSTIVFSSDDVAENFLKQMLHTALEEGNTVRWDSSNETSYINDIEYRIVNNVVNVDNNVQQKSDLLTTLIVTAESVESRALHCNWQNYNEACLTCFPIPESSGIKPGKKYRLTFTELD